MSDSMRSLRRCFPVRRMVAVATLGLASVGVRAGTFVAEDFDGSPTISATDGKATITDDGTIDSYKGKPGKCATLEATLGGKSNGAALTLRVTVATPNSERDLAKLHLAADVNVEHMMPVAIRVASLDASGKATGALVGEWLPPCAGSYFRHGVDLGTLKKAGGSTFDPTARAFDITFELAPIDGKTSSRETMHVDNVSLSAPSFYVGAKGSDNADGKTARTAFATIQKAVDASGPGDVILVGDGTYKNTNANGLVSVTKHGTPARWITLRAAPGESPKLVNDGWEVIKIYPTSAYLEFRGLDVGGNGANVALADALADGALKEKDGKKYGGDPKFNGNGISAEGREAKESAARPHHLRFIDNVVHDNCGGGLSAIACDYVTSVGNTVRNNVHYMRYGGSGISYLNLSNFDDSTTYHAYILDNVLHDNGCYVPWAAVGKMSDGNNIIIDVNRHEKTLDGPFVGRTLIANNLVVGGGGGGVTVTTSRHVDIVNNTLYHNVQTEELARKGWADVFIGGPPPNCEDVRVYNNVIWSAPGRAIITAGRADDYTFKNNVYFGDPSAKVNKGDAGDADNVVADPRLKNPSMTGGVADFAPTAGSPAIGHGVPDYVGVPLADLNGKRRPTTGSVTAGAVLPADGK